MPFPFALVCDLLSQLEEHRSTKKRGQPRSAPSRYAILHRWFSSHRTLLDHPESDMAALFSTLVPEKRTDRVYGVQCASLAPIIGKAFGILETSRMLELRKYQQPGHGDLADRVEMILSQTVG